MTRTLMAALGSLALALALGASGGSAADDERTNAEVSSTDYAKALRFRTMFGLEADQALILRAETDPDYSTDLYGVPLSAHEQRELQRRVGVEMSSRDAVKWASGESSFGGWYIDQLDRGAPVFLFKADSADLAAKREILESKLADDTGFRIRHVDLSMNDLQAIRVRIDSATDELIASGIALVSTAIHVSANRVKVGVQDLTETEAKLLTAQFGDSLEIHEDTPGQFDACSGSTGTNNCRPMKGGLSIVKNGTGGNECTSGFVVRRSQHNEALAILTAGHCIINSFGETEPTETVWNHNGNRFGETKYQTWEDGENDDKLGDVGIIELDTTEAEDLDAANKLWIYNGSSGATYTVTDYALANEQTEGVQLCAYGTNSNDSACVSVSDFDERHTSPRTINGVTVTKWIAHTNEFPLDMVSGDSGGPIYQVINSTQRRALGTHVHSTSTYSWYTPFTWGQAAYTLETPDDYVLCMDSNC